MWGSQVKGLSQLTAWEGCPPTTSLDVRWERRDMQFDKVPTVGQCHCSERLGFLDPDTATHSRRRHG